MELGDRKASEGSSWIDWSSPTDFAKSIADEAGLPSLSVDSQSEQAINGFLDTKIAETQNQNSSLRKETAEVSSLPNASDSVTIATVKKPLGAKRTGNTGGLGARKLTKKPNESLYDQKPEEPPVLVPSSDSANSPPKSFATRFQYIDNPQAAEISSEGASVLSHVSPPKSSNLFAEYEMDSCLSKETSSTLPKVQVEETDDARKRFPNAKSISSAQFFGDQNKVNDMGTSVSLQKFSGSNAISSADLFGQHCDNSSVDVTATKPIDLFRLQAEQDFAAFKIMAGETWKKLSSLASTLMSNLQEEMSNLQEEILR